MQFKNLFLAAAAATLASAVEFTNPSFPVTAGSPFNITWSDAQGPVTLTLKNGPSTALTTVSTIASGLTGTSYSWTPPASLDTSLYALEITDSTNVPNYSVQFGVSGATASASTTTASSTSASSSSASTSGSSSASTSGSSSSTSSSASSSTGSSTSSGSTSTSTSSKTSSVTTSVSKTSSASTSTGTTTATSAPTSSAADLASPLALIFLAFAAIVTLN